MFNNPNDKKGLSLSDLSNYEKTRGKSSAIESDKTLKEFLKNGGRSGAKADFKELIKRAVQPLKT